MSKIEPIITEKSMKLAEEGRYTFRVAKTQTKFAIKKLVEDVFGVHVIEVRTMNQKAETKGGMRRRVTQIPPFKKAIVKLKDKEKIDLFEVKQK